MSERSATHATFVVERSYDAPPARVFRAFADAEAKAAWSWCHPDWRMEEDSMDFRPGGREVRIAVEPDGTAHGFEAVYHDIVPGKRIVYSYGMRLGDARISVSLVTLAFEPAGAGTRLTWTEQGAFLDGHDRPDQREQGTGFGLDNLAKALEREMVGV